MLTLLINETKPLAGLFASTTGGIGSVPDISVADEGQAVSVQTFTRTAGVITDSFVAGDVLHIGIGDGVNAPVCYIELSSASPATGTMAINTVGMVALFAATVANQLTLNVGVVRTRGGNTNTIFSAPIVIHRSVIDPDTAVPTPSILGTGVAAALLVAINTALGFVRLDSSARLPAVDGSQLTNVPNELPSQTGNSGKYLTTNGTATSWGTVSGVSDGDKGDITVSNTGATWTIDNDAVTLAKLAHMPTARVVGRTTAGTGTPELLTISGTGSVAMTTSPTFTTPDLGTPSALVGTNISGTAASLTAGLVSSIGSLTGDVTSSNRATTLATVNANVGSFTNASLTVNAKGLVTAASSGTAAVTSITGTANEITVTGTTTPTLSLPSALTFTGKTVTGGTFTGSAFNGTLGATTPSTVAGTTITGTSSLTLGTNGGTGGSIVLRGSTSGSSTLSVSATGVLALPSFTVGSITVGGGVVSADRITAQNPATAALGIDISPYNGTAQVTAGHPWMRLGGGSSETLVINAGLAGGYLDICTDLGSGLRVWDGTGGHVTYLTTPATGTLRVTTNGSTLGTVDAATFTGNAATVTTIPALSGAITNTGNATVLGSFTFAQLNTAVSDADVARTDAANTFTGVQSMTSPAITTSITTPSTTFTALAGATTLLTLGGTGASSVVAIPGTLEASSSTVGSVTVAGGLSVAKKLYVGGVIYPAGQTSVYISYPGADWLAVSGRFMASSGLAVGGLLDTTMTRVSAGVFGMPALSITNTLAVTGSSTLTGNLTSNGALISTPQALSGAGAVNVTTLTTAVTTTAPAQALTLADGTNGQIKTIVHQALSGGGTWVLTPTTKTGYTTITSGAVGDTCTLQFFTTIGWCILSLRGAIAA